MRSRLIKPLRLLAIPAVIILGACENPVQADHEHVEEVESVEITDLAGVMIATLQGDQWEFEDGGDALHLNPGDAMEVKIFFVAPDGDRFQLPAAGEEHTLHVEVLNPAIVEYEAHGEHGDFNALSVGETTAEIQIYHGSHADWQADAPLPIEVVDEGGS